MNEIFPLAAGVVIAVTARRFDFPRYRISALLALSLAFGVLATVISGEWMISWGFVVVDAAEVLIAAVVVSVLLVGWQRRPSRLW